MKKDIIYDSETTEGRNDGGIGMESDIIAI